MTKTINLLISGVSGAMGLKVLELSQNDSSFQPCAGLCNDPTSHNLPLPLYSDINQVVEDVDIIIDFSSPKILDSLLDYGLKESLGLVLATTGYDEDDLKQIEKASQSIPILQTNNMSLGVTMMDNVIEQLARALKDYDLEIIEKHHNKKKDAPSGTAFSLFDALNKGRDGQLSQVQGRSGFSEGRTPNEVGLSAVRAGTIPGDHQVIFAGEDEVIEINHRAYSKAIFAKGALQAAQFIRNQNKGLFNMKDVLSHD